MNLVLVQRYHKDKSDMVFSIILFILTFMNGSNSAKHLIINELNN